MKIKSNCAVLLLAICLAFCGSVLAQEPAPAQSPLPATPKDPNDIFAAAAHLHDLSAPAVRPWHMKVSYQLYGLDSKPAEQGTFEYWWVSPKISRSTLMRAGMEQTTWRVDGKIYRKSSGKSPGFFERNLRKEMLPSLAALEMQKSGKPAFEVATEYKEMKGVVCLRRTDGPNPQSPPSDSAVNRSTVYCFAKDHPVLLAEFNPNGPSVIYQDLTKVQSWILARKIKVSVEKRTGLIATVDIVNDISSDAPELIPPSDVQTTEQDTDQMKQGNTAKDISTGILTRQVPPKYPIVDKANRVGGTVILAALIGKDGRVRDIEMLAGPSRSLCEAAAEAVSQWIYRPYTVNGEAVEIHTTINVVFNLGR